MATDKGEQYSAWFCSRNIVREVGLASIWIQYALVEIHARCSSTRECASNPLYVGQVYSTYLGCPLWEVQDSRGLAPTQSGHRSPRQGDAGRAYRMMCLLQLRVCRMLGLATGRGRHKELGDCHREIHAACTFHARMCVHPLCMQRKQAALVHAAHNGESETAIVLLAHKADIEARAEVTPGKGTQGCVSGF